MHINRREFLAVSGGIIVGLGAIGGNYRLASGAGPTASPETTDGAAKAKRTLVIIYLGGGNDSLNTVVPFGQGRYYDLRPTLAVKEGDALPLTGQIGLHPNLKGLKALYQAGKLTVINGVGYPEPDRSHFRSYDIWSTAQTKGVSPVGWLGRYLDLTQESGQSPLRAISVSAGIARPLVGASGSAVAVESLDSFKIRGTQPVIKAIRSMYGLGNGPLAVVRGKGQTAINAADAVQGLAAQYRPGVTYPKQNRLGTSLQLIVRLLAGGAGAKVMHTTYGGFDEHASEKFGHDRLMKEFDEAVTAFQADLEVHGLADQVVTFVHSEFGRRAKENGSGGTDHGAAGASFLIGSPVQGGIVGNHPSLTDLMDGDMKMGIDFRSIYATLLDKWLDGPTERVLVDRFERLPLLRA